MSVHVSGKVLSVVGVGILLLGILVTILGFASISDIDEFQYEAISNAELKIDNEDEGITGGFTIFVEASLGDSTGSGTHDFCENIIINATHDGRYFNKFNDGETILLPTNTEREVFRYQIQESRVSYCYSDETPNSVTYNNTSLVQIGHACYGCLSGVTTITAQYANGSTPPPLMWIKDDSLMENAENTVFAGFMLSCCGIFFTIGAIFIGLRLRKATRTAGNVALEQGQMPINATSMRSIPEQSAPNQTMLTEPSYDKITDGLGSRDASHNGDDPARQMADQQPSVEIDGHQIKQYDDADGLQNALSNAKEFWIIFPNGSNADDYFVQFSCLESMFEHWEGGKMLYTQKGDSDAAFSYYLEVTGRINSESKPAKSGNFWDNV